MNPETRQCKNCKQNFTIEPEDFAFYTKIQVPAPTRCPECRLVRRFMTRNERALYKRPCDKCGQDKILIFPKDSPLKVYCYACWWGEDWEASNFARDYDFNRSFMSQWQDLFRAVPRVGIIQQGFNVNSEYTNRVSDNKNCYLIFASAGNENCSYGKDFWDSKDCMDCCNVKKCELCYGCIDCFTCNNLWYGQDCNACTSSEFLYNCRNCSDCFGSVNLRNKQYCWFNEQLTKEEYFERRQALMPLTGRSIRDIYTRLSELCLKNIVPYLIEHRTQDVSGNWLEDCKNTHEAYGCFDVQDGKYLFGIIHGKDSMDFTYWAMNSELIYESSNIGRQCSQVFFSNECWDQLLRAEYCMNCHSSSDLFGCIGLRKKQYCILNKQYAKEEYEAMLPKVKAHMMSMPYRDSLGGIYAYGEKIPPEILPYAYNQTIAQEYFPLTKEQAVARGYSWREPEEKNYKISLASDKLPSVISETADSITQEIIGCAHEGKCSEMCTVAFRVTPAELEFYRRMKLPVPELCPNCRHFERLAKRNPLHLWKRSCECKGGKSKNGAYANTAKHSHGEGECPNEFETSYAPERPEIVYCEACYNSEVA